MESLRSARAAAAASGTPAGPALPASAAPSPQRGSRTPGQNPDPVTEGHLSRLADPPSSGAGGGRARADGAGGAAFHAVRTKNNIVKPVGDWKPAQNPRVPHLVWEGVGFPCISCFRFWGVTDGHLATEGVCPYACAASFAPSRAPPEAPKAPKRPSVTAWAQPAGGVPPAAAPGPPAGRGSPSLQHAAVDGDGGDGDDGAAAFPFRPLLDRGEPGPMPSTALDDDDTDWPALRSVPWIPKFQGASTSSSAAKQD
ncbi:hypothetical protein CYMTET_39838 [Cymbomonas tetramitiformis]|uniref:Uncharacterized protein n=1 Tax=Cymbomonas tetramitiformis TaxID=36881 RepID=A0AAE0CAP6_9CHLO|nr:hypothetical protein CYMTET_39838 [Cymbomonas tetramitiformis]